MAILMRTDPTYLTGFIAADRRKIDAVQFVSNKSGFMVMISRVSGTAQYPGIPTDRVEIHSAEFYRNITRSSFNRLQSVIFWLFAQPPEAHIGRGHIDVVYYRRRPYSELKDALAEFKNKQGKDEEI